MLIVIHYLLNDTPTSAMTVDDCRDETEQDPVGLLGTKDFLGPLFLVCKEMGFIQPP